MLNKTLRFAVGLMAMCVAGSAFAGLMGKQFDVGYYFPDASTPYAFASFSPESFIAGPGVDTIGNVEDVTFLNVDLTDTGLTVTFETVLSNPIWNGAAFNGIILTTADLLGVEDPVVDAGSTFGGFDASRVTLTAHQIFLNWNGLSYQNGTVLALSFAAIPSSIPEPQSMALAGLGLVLIAISRRRATRPV